MATNNVEYVIKLVDDFSKTSEKFTAQLRTMDSAYDKLGKKQVRSPFDDQNRSITQLRHNIERYRKSSESSFRTDHIKKYNMMIGQTEQKIKKLQGSTADMAKTQNADFGVKNMAIAATAAIALKTAWDKALESYKATAQVEKYTVTLKTMLRSKGGANDRMSEYSDIAKSTPFELNQVVEAGNQLQAIGRYNRANLIQIGDLAAAAGKPLDQVMAAYSKLATGQKGEGVNMFRDLLISTNDWVAATGKGISKNGELLATTEEMLAVLPKIMANKGFSGMMAEQAKTTEGKLSNLNDSIFALKVSVGDQLKPSFDRTVGSMQNIVETATKWISVPTAQKIAEEKAQLNSLVGIITDANTGEAERKRMLVELKQEYPEFLANLDLETVKNSELLSKLDQVNQAYETKMRYAAMKDFVTEEETDLQKLYRKQAQYKTYINAATEFNKEQQYLNTKYGVSESSKEFDGLFRQSKLNKKFEEMEKRYAANPKDADAKDFIDHYLNFKAQKSIVNSTGKGAFEFGTIEQKAKDNEEAIKRQTNIVNQYKKNLTGIERESLYSNAKGINTGDKSTFERLFNDKKLSSEFDSIRSKAMDKITEAEWDRLNMFVTGGAKATGTAVGAGGAGGGASAKSVAKAADAINGGGKNVKQIYINIDSLIKSNTNQFTPGQSPKDATTFMDQLTNALQMIVNDTNYAV